jgi:CMP-N-acetylneuraminic acid synthetase
MSLLAIIPARKGSKGIPGKNRAILRSKPLIFWTLHALKESRVTDNIVVSTDDPEIIPIAAEFGISIDEMRPEDLCQDTSKTVDVALHEIEKFEKRRGILVEDVLLLQPTSPLRSADDIKHAVSLYRQNDNQSLISVYRVSSGHPQIMYTMRDDKTLEPLLNQDSQGQRRQDFKDVYIRNGSIYLTKTAYLRKHGQFIDQSPCAFVMPEERSLNIDQPLDLKLAELLIETQKHV